MCRLLFSRTLVSKSLVNPHFATAGARPVPWQTSLRVVPTSLGPWQNPFPNVRSYQTIHY
jgi:hypothetical protein